MEGMVFLGEEAAMKLKQPAMGNANMTYSPPASMRLEAPFGEVLTPNQLEAALGMRLEAPLREVPNQLEAALREALEVLAEALLPP